MFCEDCAGTHDGEIHAKVKRDFSQYGGEENARKKIASLREASGADRTPRAHTQEEMQEMFLGQLRRYVHYWANEERVTDVKEKLDGLAFSFLNMLDGTSAGLPAFDIYPCPHPGDKGFHIGEGENYWPSKEDDVSVFGNSMAHDKWYRGDKKQ